MALPAGAATKNAPPVTHSVSAPSFASGVASLQGHIVTLSVGATCTVSASTCTVVTSGTSAIPSGTAMALAPIGAREALCGWFCIGLAVVSAIGVGVAIAGLGVATGGLAWGGLAIAGVSYGGSVYCITRRTGGAC